MTFNDINRMARELEKRRSRNEADMIWRGVAYLTIIFGAVMVCLLLLSLMTGCAQIAEMITGDSTASSSPLKDIGEGLDKAGPPILKMLGAAGVPGVGVIALLWNGLRKRRIEDDLIGSVQGLRRRLKDGGHADILSHLDAGLAVDQDDATIAFVKARKAKMKTESVNAS